MARRRRGVMSEELKDALAKDLGFYDTVQAEGWGGIRAKDAGNMVKRALQIAEKTLAEQSSVASAGASPRTTTGSYTYQTTPVSTAGTYARVPMGAAVTAEAPFPRQPAGVYRQ